MASTSAWRRSAARAAVLLVSASLAAALPVDNLQIESRVTEVRALPAQSLDLETAATGGNHHHGGQHHAGHHHGGEGGGHHGNVGYLRTQDSKGDHGYQKFDSFHKKNGDSYGFETHSAFGKADGKKYGDHEGHGSEAVAKVVAKKYDDHEGAGTEDVEHFSGGDGGHFSEHYTGGEGGDGGDGDGGHHFEEHYSSDGDGDGSHSGYTSGGDEGFHGFDGFH